MNVVLSLSCDDMNKIHEICVNENVENVVLERPTSDQIKTLILKAENEIGSVHFKKRSDGSIRRMCYRLHVTKPKHAKTPSSNNKKNLNEMREENNLITLFDVNKIIRDNDGEILRDKEGKKKRGAYRNVPLDGITRIAVNGVIYQILQ